VSEGEESREQCTDTGSEGKEENKGAETVGRHEGKQGAAKGMREAKTEGGAQKYTQDSDDPTAGEGGTETGMEEEYEEQKTEAEGPAGVQGRQGAEKGEVPEEKERRGAPAQEWHSQNAEGAGAHTGVSGNGEEREAGGQLESKGETSSEGQKASKERGEQDGQAAEAAGAEARPQQGNKQTAQSTGTNAVAVGGQGSRGTVDAEQDRGRSSNSSAPDYSAGGDGFSGGCEREQREAGKRKRCEEQAATEHVRAKVQRYKRMTDRGGGRLGEQLEAQVQERPWRRARKRKRQDVSESERGADAVIKKTRQTHRRIETSRHSERTPKVWERMLDEGIT
jgi:hypothetical protein